MNDLRDLYQDIIVDHNRAPRNFRAIESPSYVAEGFNPLCGDKLKLYLTVDGDTITDISFQGSGCAISVASASLMTERLKGRPLSEAEGLFGQMHALLAGDMNDVDESKLGKLAALSGVREYPSRVKCATLCWHTMHSALGGGNGNASATTE